MKTKPWGLIFLAGISLNGHANDCGKGGPFERLSAWNGRHRLGQCEIEAHLCERPLGESALPFYLESALKENNKFWIGDIYVKHADGQSLYVPIYSAESKFPNTWITVDNGPEFLGYYYQDRNYDPVSGLKEKYSIVFSKRRSRIEFKMKNSRESRRRPVRSLFFPNVKIVCEDTEK